MDKNPIVAYTIEKRKENFDSTSIVESYMESDLYDGIASKKTIQNRVGEVLRIADMVENQLATDFDRTARILDKTIKANELEIKLRTYDMTGEDAIRQHEGLDALTWECTDIMVRSSNNASNPWYITQGKFRRRTEIDPLLMLEKMQPLLQDYKPFKATACPPMVGNYLLEIDPPDAHIGMMNWDNSETCAQQCEKYKRAVMHMLTESAKYDVDEIVFMIGSDLFHVNADKPETRKGTPQDVNEHSHHVNEQVTVMIMDLIFTMMDYGRMIHLKLVPGNHDYHNVSWLGILLNHVFSKCDNVEVDYLPDLRKYHVFGCTAFTFTHELKRKEDKLSVTMFHELKDRGMLTDKVKYYEVHGGHLHEPSKKEMPSETTNQKITQRVLSSLCSPGAYSRDAYGMKTVESQGFLYSKDKGIEKVIVYRE